MGLILAIFLTSTEPWGIFSMKNLILVIAFLSAPSAFASVECVAYCISPASQPGIVRVTKLFASAPNLRAAEQGWLRQCANFQGEIGEVTNPAALEDGYDVHFIPMNYVRPSTRLNCD